MCLCIFEVRFKCEVDGKCDSLDQWLLGGTSNHGAQRKGSGEPCAEISVHFELVRVVKEGMIS